MSLTLEKISAENRWKVLESELNKYQLGVVRFLSEDELRAIDGTDFIEPADYFFIALARRMEKNKPATASHLDARYRPVDRTEYMQRQRTWMKREEQLLGERLQHIPTSLEFVSDFARYQNGLTFKLYILFKEPNKMERIF